METKADKLSETPYNKLKEKDFKSWPIEIDKKGQERFLEWCLCFLVINFDIKLGQDLEIIYPYFNFSEEERKNICFSSFPDSNLEEEIDIVYSFRIRLNTLKKTIYNFNASENFINGYVFFSQKRDTCAERGYFQKSVILLSVNSFPGIFSKIVSILGQNYFLNYDISVLETAIRNISKWPSFKSNFILKLPFMGDVYYTDIFPSSIETSYIENIYSLRKFPTEKHISAFTFGAPLFSYFHSTIVSLYTIWEVILLGKPLLLLTDNPNISTEMVLTLMDLIKPLKYSGDYRPYFTIQGNDFAIFLDHAHVSCKSFILGVTNPVIIKFFENICNIILMRKNNLITNTNNIKQYSIVITPTLKFIHKRTVAKDKRFLQKISNIRINLLSKRDYIVLNNFVLCYFSKLTENFLKPIDKYLFTLMPTEINLFKDIPKLKPFREKDFLNSLASYGPFIPFKKTANYSKSYTCRLFYGEFLKSPNFFSYLVEKQKILSYELTQKYFKYLCTVNIKKNIEENIFEINKLLKRIDKILNYNEVVMPENEIFKHSKTTKLETDDLNIDIDYPIKLSQEQIKLLNAQRKLLNDIIADII
ncbi:hypothetical protein MERGE_002099 [Pneumocystis wakefieldiae]|uniref:UDENN domain-containing protein n=1 Tax=Pneumocystis wakefieldiae TaxID=38082 RepID=A0A899G8B1_9ASCO|nr:hypothetical protein MERGE_002099 [Pneumocystis wakefieldiae]